MSATLQDLILRTLCTDFTFRQKVLLHMNPEYFETNSGQTIVRIMREYCSKYDTNVIDASVLKIEAERLTLSEDHFKEINKHIDSLASCPQTDLDWLIPQTERFAQERAVYLALVNSITVWEENKKKGTGLLTSIPAILEQALSVSFDNSLGHDYFDDAETYFDTRQEKIEQIPFNHREFDEITVGGLKRKTLNICMAGTGGGKSLFMCNYAAQALQGGYNVLYLTMELSENDIRQRIDANMMRTGMREFERWDKKIFLSAVHKLKSMTHGRLKIKEYEGGIPTALHFKQLINEYKTKHRFVPDVIIVDYLGICASSRVKLSQGSYLFNKSIAEELRGLGQWANAAVLTGMQFNREGMTSSDPNLGNTADSVGVPFTADLIFAIVITEDLAALNQALVKQMKTRYNDLNYMNRFVIGLDKAQMRVFEVEQSGQLSETDEEKEMTALFDKTDFGAQLKAAKTANEALDTLFE